MKNILQGLKGLLGERAKKTAEIASTDIPRQLKTFQRDIKYKFRDESLLQLALKHRSWQGDRSNRRGRGRDGSRQPDDKSDSKRIQNPPRDHETNERLEFLGDSVLNLVVSDSMFRKFPTRREGELTRYKSLIVNGNYLMKRAIDIGLGRLIFMSNSEEKMGGRQRDSILEDAYEALIGAIYLDGGLEEARSFIDRHILAHANVEKLDVRNRNHKSALLEFAQGRHLGMPEYKTVSEKGPDHQRAFLIEVSLQNVALAQGEGNSKKGAQQQAAEKGLRALTDPRKELIRKLKRH